jgi:hypothetical protein
MGISLAHRFHLRNSFPFVGLVWHRRYQPDRRLAMYIQQDAPAALPLSFRLQAIVAKLARSVKITRQADAVGSRLDPHLLYDIGEIDYDLGRTKSNHPSSLMQALLSHHYPR